MCEATGPVPHITNIITISSNNIFLKETPSPFKPQALFASKHPWIPSTTTEIGCDENVYCSGMVRSRKGLAVGLPVLRPKFQSNHHVVYLRFELFNFFPFEKFYDDFQHANTTWRVMQWTCVVSKGAIKNLFTTYYVAKHHAIGCNFRVSNFPIVPISPISFLFH